ncbi:MAG: hypothetical protein KJ571_04390 [Bacteroidetes bacterium]|nr:hypothetical protein [Bacteroidota bacterium]
MKHAELIKYKNLILTLVLVILITIPEINTAQLSAGFSTTQVYDSNPYRSPIAEAEIISSYSGGIEYDFTSFNFLYYGSYSLFNKSVERNNYWHQFGFYKSGEDNILGIYGEQRINKELYNYYDYISVTGYYRKKLDSLFMNPVLNLSAGYKNYTNLSDYNNVFISAGLNLNRSFDTKTALILNSALNYKYYLNTGSMLGARNNSSALSSTQLYFNFRAAQSLFENTGLAVYYINRSLLGESLSLLGDYYSSYGDESDLFDDPYSRNENAFGAELTQILPLEIIAKTGFEISSRNYPSQGIYINSELYETGTDREDSQNAFYLQMNKTIPLDSANQTSLNFGINYSYINKSSNSYWYDYKGSTFTINLGLQF